MKEWLVKMRKSSGMSQAAVAEACGISQSYYAAIETGARGRKLPAQTARKIAAVLHFPWTQFYADMGGE